MLKHNQSRAAAADQDKVTLNLKRGENRLLVKIVNFAGPSGFYFAAKPTSRSCSPDVLAAANRLASERSPEEGKLVRQFFRNTTAQSAALDQLALN